MRKQFLMVLILIVPVISLSAQHVIQSGKTYYLSNTLIVKVKSGATSVQLNKILAKVFVISAKELYPSKGILNKAAGTDALSGIYHVKYNSTEDPIELAVKVAEMPEVLWAEPKFIRRICYTPADSLFSIGKQENLLQIDAAHAWDITTGNKKVIIAIIDTGVDWLHPDIAANIYMENDSLIPGCDLGGLNGTPDNDPSEDIDPRMHYHGTLVAGIAGAATDNEIGVASIGFNCSILPVKAAIDNFRDEKGVPLILLGYEGIKWAADQGAKVINCSWGGYGYSSYEQSIIDYALEKGAVIVAAQGNDTSTANFYPADYDGVLSVGWLNTGNKVKTVNLGANYGEKVKVFAPGSNIYSTWQRQTQSSPAIYRAAGGSSLSSPLVSGLAGLVWSKFPYFTPMQVVERIRVTSDYIDDYNGSSYKYLLGHGVINAFRAVDESINAVSVQAGSIRFTDMGNGDGNFKGGEEISVKMNFTNYLAAVDNVSVTLTTTDNYAAVKNSTFNTGPMNTLTTISNESNQFKFKIAGNVPDDHTINFLLKYSNGTDYSDFQWFRIKVTGTRTIQSNNYRFRLDQNYPNPFNPTTEIGYRLSGNGMVTLKVYDILGRNVAILVDEFQQAGDYQVQLSADSYRLSSGVYFYRLTAGSLSSTKKMILVK